MRDASRLDLRERRRRPQAECQLGRHPALPPLTM